MQAQTACYQLNNIKNYDILYPVKINQSGGNADEYPISVQDFSSVSTSSQTQEQHLKE